MKNIFDILADAGIVLTDEQKTAVNKSIAESYITRAEHDKKIGRIEGERDSYKNQYETASETLRGFDGVDVNAMNQSIADWKKKAEDAEANYQRKLYDRDFSDALRGEMDGIKFTSDAARKAVEQAVKESGLKLSNGKILGLSDLISQMKEQDKGAFVDEEAEEAERNKAKFTDKHGGGDGGKKTYSMAEVMRMKNENPDLDISQFIQRKK